MLVRLSDGQARDAAPGNLVVCRFIMEGTVRGEKNFFVFLEGRLVPIISSPFRLSRGVFLSLHGQARSSNCFSRVQRECPRDG